MLQMSKLSKKIYNQLEKDKEYLEDILKCPESEEQERNAIECLEEIKTLQEYLEEGEFCQKLSKRKFEKLFYSHKFCVAAKISQSKYCEVYYFNFHDGHDGYYFYTNPIGNVIEDM